MLRSFLELELCLLVYLWKVVLIDDDTEEKKSKKEGSKDRGDKKYGFG